MARTTDISGRAARIARQSLRLAQATLAAVFYPAAFVVIGISGWATYESVATVGWTADAAAWAQAAGSVAAILGAAWLAQGEAHRARRERRRQGEEAAWFARFAVMQAQREAHIVAAEWVNGTALDMSDVQSWRQRMATVAISLDALLTRSDFVHPAAVHTLANAKVIVDALVAELAQFSGPFEDGRIIDDTVTASVVAPHHLLDRLLSEYDYSMRGVMEALDEGDDALPIGRTFWQQDGGKTSKP